MVGRRARECRAQGGQPPGLAQGSHGPARTSRFLCAAPQTPSRPLGRWKEGPPAERRRRSVAPADAPPPAAAAPPVARARAPITARSQAARPRNASPATQQGQAEGREGVPDVGAGAAAPFDRFERAIPYFDRARDKPRRSSHRRSAPHQFRAAACARGSWHFLACSCRGSAAEMLSGRSPPGGGG